VSHQISPGAPRFAAVGYRSVRYLVEAQVETLARRMGISGDAPRRLLEVFGSRSLGGPYHDGRRRFSAINRDGIPFQWSVSVGSRRGGLRFITDCGIPGTSISERVRYTREAIARASRWLPVGADVLIALDMALDSLLPNSELLDQSIMGTCVGAEIRSDGTARLKIYVNGEVGEIRERYKRFSNCLAVFGRPGAMERLRDLAHAAGDRIVPAFSAIDLTSGGIGRLKLYFRPSDGSPALQALAARAVGCSRAGEVLDTLHGAFLRGSAYPSQAVDLSVEFPVHDDEPGFKVDLRAVDFLENDADTDRRICRLITTLGACDAEYQTMLDVVVGRPVSDRVEQILFIGLASRRGECQTDVYFHPGSSVRSMT
jgi:hypothetical protein